MAIELIAPSGAVCAYCNTDLHWQCTREGDECCCVIDIRQQPVPAQQSLNLPVAKPEPIVITEDEDKPKRGRPRLEQGEFTNSLTAGRQRALRERKVKPGQICDWAWMFNCGGGIQPVHGCTGRNAQDIHHGPDKSVLNNDDDNVSVICRYCHQLWHHRNDPYYSGTRPEDGASWLPDGISHALSEMQPARTDDEFRAIIQGEIALARPNVQMPPLDKLDKTGS